ncbi:MAG: 4Fe-4S dicluster domain-containing protein, partial [Eubacteriales bacterium]
DYSQIISSRKGTLTAQCMYCNHCQPCPAEIDIAAVTRLMDAAILDGKVSARMREEYTALAHKPDACISCGNCEARCPFGVGVIENMNKMQELFEK